jgi:hypothetical protein
LPSRSKFAPKKNSFVIEAVLYYSMKFLSYPTKDFPGYTALSPSSSSILNN